MQFLDAPWGSCCRSCCTVEHVQTASHVRCVACHLCQLAGGSQHGQRRWHNTQSHESHSRLQVAFCATRTPSLSLKAAGNHLLLMLQVINRWLSVRVELISNSVILATALLVAVVLPVNAGLAGLALTSAINVTDNLAWLVRQVGHKAISELQFIGGQTSGLSCDAAAYNMQNILQSTSARSAKIWPVESTAEQQVG